MRTIYIEKVYKDNLGRMMYRNVASNIWYKDTTLNEDVQKSSDLHTFSKDGEPDSPLPDGLRMILFEGGAEYETQCDTCKSVCPKRKA